ncbi:hypothetical protein PDY_08660 [Photobacterium damselae subsp. damselae]|uniref:DUF1294 domain-containing protein n=1 Tax=Photobacterium damselae TaxID=38293 RepID=UPI002205A396|nr:DUF1294 domain-containing protein [Photobacterium damselae]BDR33818.1 hypothetical protein PDY_08660 [Photobacterium damselae subsp. damselae]
MIVLALGFLIFVLCSVFFFKIPLFLFVIYCVMSLVTFLFYWKDKRAAVRGEWRIPEKTLHIMELACGWPGALVAQQTLRHKSQKQPFKLILWMAIVANSAIFIWLLTPMGMKFLHTLGVI